MTGRLYPAASENACPAEAGACRLRSGSAERAGREHPAVDDEFRARAMRGFGGYEKQHVARHFARFADARSAARCRATMDRNRRIPAGAPPHEERRPCTGPGDSSPGTVNVDPHRPLTPPVSGHPSAPGAARDPASGHPYIAAALPAPVAVGPHVAMRPRWRWAAVMPQCRRREARAVGIRGPARPGRRSWGPISGRCGLSRGGTQPTAGDGEGGGHSDGAQQRASMHGGSSI